MHEFDPNFKLQRQPLFCIWRFSKLLEGPLMGFGG